MKKSGSSGPGGKERRRSPRRPVLDTFSLFAVLPKKGSHRLKIHDVSELGIAFDFDLEGEDASASSVTQGESYEVHVFLNPTLYIPMTVAVARIDRTPTGRKIGAEFTGGSPDARAAIEGFVQLLDRLEKGGRVAGQETSPDGLG